MKGKKHYWYFWITIILVFFIGYKTGTVFPKAFQPSFHTCGPRVYFSPGIEKELVGEIEKTNKSIDIAVYAFTSEVLAKKLIEAKNRGIYVRVLLDEGMDKETHEGDALEKSGIAVKRMKGKEISGKTGIMHHKFAIFDDAIIVTGSFNWTYSGEFLNKENIIRLCDSQAVSMFIREFSLLWEKN